LGLYAAATTITNYAGDLYHYSGAVTTASHYAGTWYDLTTATYGTLTTEAVYNASGVGTKTITNATVSAGGSIVDTSDRVTYTNPIAWRGTLTVT
jgi:hypothetical protein